MKCSQELVLGSTGEGGARRAWEDHQRTDWKESLFPEESRLQWLRSRFITH